MSDEEEWRTVPGYSGRYEVSSIGRVRSTDWIIHSTSGQTYPHRGKMLTHTKDTQTGYLSVKLRVDGTSRRRTVHSLVAEAFIGPRPEGMEVCHNDGNRQNPRLENLRYDTSSNNHKDRVIHGTMWQSNRTHCPSGHEYTEENIYLYDGRRYCRACRSGKRNIGNREA